MKTLRFAAQGQGCPTPYGGCECDHANSLNPIGCRCNICGSNANRQYLIGINVFRQMVKDSPPGYVKTMTEGLKPPMKVFGLPATVQYDPVWADKLFKLVAIPEITDFYMFYDETHKVKHG